MEMEIGNRVKIIGGNNEIGQHTMIGRIGVVSSIGTEYTVKEKPTMEIYVDFTIGGYSETHVFNDYHLELLDEA